MNNTVKNKHKNGSSLKTAMIVLALTTLVGCEADPKEGVSNNTQALPLELTLSLKCADEGIHDEPCILEDNNNPFKRSIVNDDNKFDLANDAPSAKTRFYLWGTAQAQQQTGENQYYTATALHEMYTQGGSEVARDQAIKAYRAVLDHYFDSFTYFKVALAQGDVFISLVLSDQVGARIYDPFDDGLAQLFGSQVEALGALGSWGYNYDTSTGTVSKAR